MNKMTGMKIRYRFWVWALCLMFPTLVWAENAVRTCTSFTQQGRRVTFHLADSAASVSYTHLTLPTIRLV